MIDLFFTSSSRFVPQRMLYDSPYRINWLQRFSSLAMIDVVCGSARTRVPPRSTIVLVAEKNVLLNFEKKKWKTVKQWKQIRTTRWKLHSTDWLKAFWAPVCGGVALPHRLIVLRAEIANGVNPNGLGNQGGGVGEALSLVHVITKEISCDAF